MQKSHTGVGQKKSLWNKKTKIYQTIKGLIILFIKLEFSIKCNKIFKLLHNIYLNLSLNSNGFVICIISNTFVSSPIRLMILDLA